MSELSEHEASPDVANGEPELGRGWFDNHCHLTSLKREPAVVIAEAATFGIDYLLTVGCDLDDSARAIEIASGFDNVWATAGIHPHEAEPFLAMGDEGRARLESMATEGDIVAVGECGLDYFYEHSPREAQRQVFEYQIDLAHRLDQALVIHTRDAWSETFDILDSCGMPPRTVFHCFTGGPDEAAACLERGAYLSFSGIVTFKTAEDLREAARITPLDRTLVETDSPYLAPVPHRGQTNRPALVSVVGQAVANIQDLTLSEMATASWRNGQLLYGA